jgi:hypothetical protein
VSTASTGAKLMKINGETPIAKSVARRNATTTVASSSSGMKTFLIRRINEKV